MNTSVDGFSRFCLSSDIVVFCRVFFDINQLWDWNFYLEFLFIFFFLSIIF